MKITAAASPNHSARPRDTAVSCIVLHNDEADDAQKSVSWIRSPRSRVSYHVLVDRDGHVFRFVDTARRAWHCGVSVFEGRADVNDFSIGLSFANKNDGVELYTPEQYEVGAMVAAAWVRVHPAIMLDYITTHAAIARCDEGCAIDLETCEHYPAGRKRDPGPCWEMPRFLERVSMELRKGTVT